MPDNEVLIELRAMREDIKKLTVQQAVLTERVDTSIVSVSEHLAADKVFHASIDERVDKLEHFRTSLKAKVGTYAAVFGFAFALVGSMLKDFVMGLR